MKRWLVVCVAVVGCGDAKPPATAITQAAAIKTDPQIERLQGELAKANADRDALGATVANLAQRLESIESQMQSAANERAAAAQRAAEPRAIDASRLRREATAIVGRLNAPERYRLVDAVAALNAGTLSRSQRVAISEFLHGRCDHLLGLHALAEMAKRDSPGFQWAAKNLSPEQANRVEMLDVMLRSTARRGLARLAEGGEFTRSELELLESSIGGHPALEKYYTEGADEDLVSKVTDLMKKSAELEQQ